MAHDIDRSLWPYEVVIQHPNGRREYHQHARDNADGTVTVYELDLPGGYVERTYPREIVTLSERPWEVAERWYRLFNQVYGNDTIEAPEPNQDVPADAAKRHG